jgi:hypothetical protein
MDFYAEAWRAAALQISPYADLPQPMVLINGNFSLANRWGGPARSADPAKLVVEQAAVHQLSGLANRLAAVFPRVTFVYRPHPFESPDYYRDLIDRRPNLRVVKRGGVEGWILRSSAVVQRGCSTAIEAVCAGVPALSPEWIPVHDAIESVQSVSIRCASEEDLLDCVRAAVSGALPLPHPVKSACEAVIHEWFFRIDGCAHERVASAILRALGSGNGPSERAAQDFLDHVAGPDVPLQRRLRTGLQRALRLPRDWSFRRWRRQSRPASQSVEPAFTLGDVEQMASAVATGSVRVQPARDHFRFGHRNGSSVALSPA